MITPTTVTAAPSPNMSQENSRGAVPGPKAKPRWPGKSAEAMNMNVARIMSTRPP